MVRLLIGAAILVCAAGAAQAQRVQVPHTPPTIPAVPVPVPVAPPIAAPPAIPVLPTPTVRSPELAAPQPPTQGVPPCRRPQDCPDGSADQQARQKFAACVEQARITTGSLDTKKLEDCALGFMAPNKFLNFKQCLGRRETAWECFRQGYLN